MMMDVMIMAMVAREQRVGHEVGAQGQQRELGGLPDLVAHAAVGRYLVHVEVHVAPLHGVRQQACRAPKKKVRMKLEKVKLEKIEVRKNEVRMKSGSPFLLPCVSSRS